ncbi:MAG: molybdate ABC transporter substrate-binding protein [Verrucomicrobiota bacterium]
MKPSFLRRLSGIALILCATVLFRAVASAEEGTTLTISAAASLREALDEIRSLYVAGHTNTAIHFNHGGSGALQRQIENGAPVDIFFSAGASHMDALEKKGLLFPETRRDLLLNRLVLITPLRSATVKGFPDLANRDVRRIAIGEPKSVPVGTYAMEIFTRLHLVESLAPKLVRMLDVRQVLTTIETANADAGIVYLTDAKLSQKVRIAADAPENSHSPAIYPAAVIKETKSPAAALAFMEFLTSEPARKIFVKFGFGIVP